MADLINRQALMEYPIRINHYDKEHGNLDFALGIESVLEYAEHLPTVEAVEVVRCKDCKHYNQSTYGDMCKFWVDWLPTESDDFCSYGERRANNG